MAAVMFLTVGNAGAQQYPPTSPQTTPTTLTPTTTGGVGGTGAVRTTLQPVAAQGGTLPRTGSDATRLAVSGVVLVGLGAGAVVATRRRRLAA